MTEQIAECMTHEKKLARQWGYPRALVGWEAWADERRTRGKGGEERGRSYAGVLIMGEVVCRAQRVVVVAVKLCEVRVEGGAGQE